MFVRGLFFPKLMRKQETGLRCWGNAISIELKVKTKNKNGIMPPLHRVYATDTVYETSFIRLPLVVLSSFPNVKQKTTKATNNAAFSLGNLVQNRTRVHCYLELFYSMNL